MAVLLIILFCIFADSWAQNCGKCNCFERTGVVSCANLNARDLKVFLSGMELFWVQKFLLKDIPNVSLQDFNRRRLPALRHILTSGTNFLFAFARLDFKVNFLKVINCLYNRSTTVLPCFASNSWNWKQDSCLINRFPREMVSPLIGLLWHAARWLAGWNVFCWIPNKILLVVESKTRGWNP